MICECAEAFRWRNPPRPPASPPTRAGAAVVAAGARDDPGTREALASLCGDYWYPLYALIRRKGHDPERALDLTQAYFARLLETPVIAAADPSKGRFRAFLRTDCGHFLADQCNRDRAIKRGGDRVFVPIDADAAEGRYRIEPADELTPEPLSSTALPLGRRPARLRFPPPSNASTPRPAAPPCSRSSRE